MMSTVGALHGELLGSFRWAPGIGDPTVGGWATVFLYFSASASCWRTARRLHYPSRERRIWWTTCILFLALGINKQLDLQTAMTDAGRIITVFLGWYAKRDLIQLGFIVAVAVSCTGTAIVLVIWAKNAPLASWVALVGLISVIGFVLIRAASFHHVDRFIGTAILGLRWNWILEMGGIGVVLVASLWRHRTLMSK